MANTTFETIVSRSLDKRRLASLLLVPEQYLGEKVRTIVPSLHMTNEGPVLNKLFLVTERYFCEVAITEVDSAKFDVIDFRRVSNIRVTSGTTTVNAGEEVITSYKTARIDVIHSYLGLSSTVEFVGEERDAWLTEVFETFPASLLLDSP